MAHGDDTDYLMDGLEKSAMPADYDQPIPALWTTAEMEDGSPALSRPSNPFADLASEVQGNVEEGQQIEDEIRGRANFVAEMQDALYSTAASKTSDDYITSWMKSFSNEGDPDSLAQAAKVGLDLGMDYPVDRLIQLAEIALAQRASRRRKASFDDLHSAQPVVDDLNYRVDQHLEDESQLKNELENQTDEVVGLIDLFQERQAKKKPTKVKHTHSHEHRVTEVKKGQQVVTPNGPGKVEDVYDEGRSVLVRLTDGPLRPYRTNRLSKLAAWRPFDEYKVGDVYDVYGSGAAPVEQVIGDELILETGEVIDRTNHDVEQNPKPRRRLDREYADEDDEAEVDEIENLYDEEDDFEDDEPDDDGLTEDDREEIMMEGEDWANDHPEASLQDAMGAAQEMEFPDLFMEGVYEARPELKPSKRKKGQLQAEGAMTPVRVSPDSAKAPPSFLPGVHDPKSPMRPKKRRPQPKREEPVQELDDSDLEEIKAWWNKRADASPSNTILPPSGKQTDQISDWFETNPDAETLRIQSGKGIFEITRPQNGVATVTPTTFQKGQPKKVNVPAFAADIGHWSVLAKKIATVWVSVASNSKGKPVKQRKYDLDEDEAAEEMAEGKNKDNKEAAKKGWVPDDDFIEEIEIWLEDDGDIEDDLEDLVDDFMTTYLGDYPEEEQYEERIYSAAHDILRRLKKGLPAKREPKPDTKNPMESIRDDGNPIMAKKQADVTIVISPLGDSDDLFADDASAAPPAEDLGGYTGLYEDDPLRGADDTDELLEGTFDDEDDFTAGDDAAAQAGMAGMTLEDEQ